MSLATHCIPDNEDCSICNPEPRSSSTPPETCTICGGQHYPCPSAPEAHEANCFYGPPLNGRVCICLPPKLNPLRDRAATPSSPPAELTEALDELVMGALHTGMLSRESANYKAVLALYNRQREEIERLQSDKAAHREQFEELASQLERLQEQEASICPEDVGFVEYIASLERRVERLKAEQLTPTMARKVVAVLEDPQVFRALRPLETGTLAALRLRSLSDQKGP